MLNQKRSIKFTAYKRCANLNLFTPYSNTQPTLGFTLIEVLVALVVFAIGLGAATRAVSTVTTTSYRLNSAALALISAENILSDTRIEAKWPPISTNTNRCDQGNTELLCEQTVSATTSPVIRKLTVTVYAADKPRTNNGGKLATVVSIIIQSTVL